MLLSAKPLCSLRRCGWPYFAPTAGKITFGVFAEKLIIINH